jgi:translation initiation factor 1A
MLNMPKKVKSKKNKKSSYTKKDSALLLKTEFQEYAQVIKLLGNCRMECNCFDGVVRICKVRSKIKRCRININDIVLVSLREVELNKGDILHKYDSSSIHQLENMFEIPKIDRISDDGDACGIVFESEFKYDDENENSSDNDDEGINGVNDDDFDFDAI